MKKVRAIAVAITVTILFVAAVMFLRFFLPFLPGRAHNHISISLPFNDDNLTFVNPMGETINHPKPANPHGHPGIDFAWDYPVKIIASATGRVSTIKIHKGFDAGHPTWDVEVVTGDYATRYTELDGYAVKKGQQVKQGDLIGTSGSYSTQGRSSYSIHWEFDYNTVWFDRLCPLTYFDSESRNRIDAIWAKTGNTFQGKYPTLCSGDYFERDQ